jgi:hypothetical protein
MNIEAFLLCDCATDTQGKLNVLGAFDRLFVRQMPCVHPACTVACRIRFTRVEQGEHKIKLNIMDEDGNTIGPKKLGGNINVGFKEGTDSVVMNFVLHFQRLKFEKYGQYQIDLALDGRSLASLPLYVTELPTAR